MQQNHHGIFLGRIVALGQAQQVGALEVIDHDFFFGFLGVGTADEYERHKAS
jgi:hypothetical protein